jgi:hypothetical protein
MILHAIPGWLTLPPAERSSIVRDRKLQAFDGEHLSGDCNDLRGSSGVLQTSDAATYLPAVATVESPGNSVEGSARKPGRSLFYFA